MIICGMLRRKIQESTHKLATYIGVRCLHSLTLHNTPNYQRTHLKSVIHTCLPSDRATFSNNSNHTNPDVAPSAIHNVQSITSKWSEKFAEKKIPEPDVSAELIVAHVLGMKTVSSTLKRSFSLFCTMMLFYIYH